MTDIRSVTSAFRKTSSFSYVSLAQYLLMLLAAYIDSGLLLGLVLFSLVITVIVKGVSGIEDPHQAITALGGLMFLFVIGVVATFVVVWIVAAIDNMTGDAAVLSACALLVWYLTRDTRDKEGGFLHQSGLKYTSGYLRKHRDTLRKEIRYDASVFGNAVSKKIRADREMALAAIASKADNYKLASAEIRSDPTFVIEVFDNKDIYYAQQKHKILELLTSDILADPRIQKRLEEPKFWNGSHGLQKIQKKFIPDEKFRDRSFVLSLVRSNPYIFSELDKSFRSDREILESALEGNGMFEYAPEHLRSDRELVLKAVSINAFNLSAASEELRGDREIVLEAIRRFHGEDYEFNSFLEDHVAEEKFLDDEIYETAGEVFVSIVWDRFASYEDWADDEDNEEGLDKRPTNFDEVLSYIDSSLDLSGERFCEVPRKLEQAHRERMKAASAR